MKRLARRAAGVFCLAVLVTSALIACSPAGAKQASPGSSGSEIPLVSVKEVLREPEAYRDKLVKMQGYGVIVATYPLPPGWVGMDCRSRFVDFNRDMIVAQVDWRRLGPLGSVDPYDPEHVRTFKGYIRMFSGKIGAPWSVKVDSFPYFEIVGIEQS